MTISIIIFLLLALCPSKAEAQRISRSYNDQSMSKVLIDLDRASSFYHVSFIYNELEDFIVTKQIDDRPVVDALRDVIGYYPIAMHIGDSLITVECINKTDRRLIGQLTDEANRPVTFANIQLFSIADSTFITGGVSNENGHFVIPCSTNTAIMRITCIGYKTIERNVNISEIGTIKMTGDQYAINGIVVKGHHRVDKVDR